MPTIDLGVAMALAYEESTRCAHWPGPLSSDGLPIQHVGGKQQVVARVIFERVLCPLPRWARLRRVCGSPRCVHYYHYVLKAPRRVATRLGYNLDDLRGVASLLRGRVERDDNYEIWWETDEPAGVVTVMANDAVARFIASSESQALGRDDRPWVGMTGPAQASGEGAQHSSRPAGSRLVRATKLTPPSLTSGSG